MEVVVPRPRTARPGGAARGNGVPASSRRGFGAQPQVKEAAQPQVTLMVHMYLLYNLALCVYFVACIPLVGYRAWRRGKPLGRLGDRFGRPPAALNPHGSPSIWIHAVSVGEALAAKTLVAPLKATYPAHRLLVSTTTASGQLVARQLQPAADATFYAPLDFPPCVAGTLDCVAPDLLVLVDTEVWPNLLRACRRRGVRTIIVNGRVSDRSYRGYRLVRRFLRRALDGVDRVCAQNELWGRRFLALGLSPERLTVTGSLKFDAAGDAAAAGDADAVLRSFQFAAGRPVFIAASTLRGEEGPVLRAFSRARQSNADALLIIAPRHPERFAEAEAVAAGQGFAVARRTDLDAEAAPAADVIVLDTIGELARLFQLATVVFVGGSLVPAGGHNILEPAVFGRPVLFGPHMENFAGVADLFVERDAAWQIHSESELGEALATLLADAERREALGAAARELVDGNRGARQRTLAAIRALLPPAAGSTEWAT